MQCISLRSSFVAPVGPSRRSYRPMVVRANIGDDVLKTFSPSKDNHPKSGVQTGFSASPKHHGGREPGRQSSSKPFADGYQKGGQVKLTKKEADQATEQEGEEEEGVAEYLGEAVQNLAGHNFTGDETEPPKNTGAAGWKGAIHDRKTDGFHTRKI